MGDQAIMALTGVGLPVLFVWFSLAAAFMRMAKRKGVSTPLTLIGTFPAWVLLFGAWLIIRADKSEPAAEEGQNEEEAESGSESHDAEPPARGASSAG